MEAFPSAMRRSSVSAVRQWTGDNGTMAMAQDSWTIYDPEGVAVSTGKAGSAATGDVAHPGNFIEAIRGRAKFNRPIREEQKSTLMCHLGNIACRTGIP